MPAGYVFYFEKQKRNTLNSVMTRKYKYPNHCTYIMAEIYFRLFLRQQSFVLKIRFVLSCQKVAEKRYLLRADSRISVCHRVFCENIFIKMLNLSYLIDFCGDYMYNKIL